MNPIPVEATASTSSPSNMGTNDNEFTIVRPKKKSKKSSRSRNEDYITLQQENERLQNSLHKAFESIQILTNKLNKLHKVYTSEHSDTNDMEDMEAESETELNECAPSVSSVTNTTPAMREYLIPSTPCPQSPQVENITPQSGSNKRPATPTSPTTSNTCDRKKNKQSHPEVSETMLNLKRVPKEAVKKSSVPTAPQIVKAKVSSGKQLQSTPSINKDNTTQQPISAAAPTIAKTKPMPPIVVYDVDVKQTQNALKEHLGHENFLFKRINRNCTHIITKDRVSFDKANFVMKNSNLESHTFDPKEDRCTNVVLRGLCRSFTTDDITAELANLQLNINVRSVRPLTTERSKREGHQLDLWLIQLAPQSDVKSVLSIKRFLHQTNIRFERQASKSVSQCFKCQHYGHSSRNCSRAPRCVKCAESHDSRECTLEKTVDSVTRCVNCKGAHTANFRGCPHYQTLLKRKQQAVNDIKERQVFAQTSANNYRQPTVSFANMVKNQRASPAASATPVAPTTPVAAPAQTSAGFNGMNQDCNAFFGLSIAGLMSKIIEYSPLYYSQPQSTRPLALLEFLFSITPNNSNV